MSTTIWRFTDGKAGHDNQTRGLVQALGERLQTAVSELDVTGFGSTLTDLCSRRYRPGRHLPDPDLLVGAGHATHWHLLAARRARGGRIIVLMKPSLPLSWFDLCLVPVHDNPPAVANLLPTRGVLNTIRPGSAHDANTGLIVVGGPSRHFRWSDDLLLNRIEALLQARSCSRWILTTSRRTPASLAGRLAGLANVEYVPFASTDSDWLPARLAEAGEVWVSEDSVSMLYEALSSGAQVGLLGVSRAASVNRVSNGIGALVADGLVAAPGDDWQLPACRQPPLDEAGRCADWIADQWLNAS